MIFVYIVDSNGQFDILMGNSSGRIVNRSFQRYVNIKDQCEVYASGWHSKNVDVKILDENKTIVKIFTISRELDIHDQLDYSTYSYFVKNYSKKRNLPSETSCPLPPREGNNLCKCNDYVDINIDSYRLENNCHLPDEVIENYDNPYLHIERQPMLKVD